jgi:hypothetical protein
VFHAERRTDRHDEANSRFSQFCERVTKKKGNLLINLAVMRVGAAIFAVEKSNYFMFSVCL